ncbi:ATP-binding cassette domain-containing protein [Mesorhizobium sp. L2C066B000]|uniref:ABC transporter ATP-binding protein n=1 Tax=Mesorhizobium sp. L2C066B000 TaxID=1287105 RepID=UPI0003CFF083|nr:ATP-binding cassette domain-containing protein [Mesorhizobium sp. L2C066B000]ESZ37904.1 amino acid ABC transporter ATP-binding protein [Mesorhizobium sp. L2C066B000]
MTLAQAVAVQPDGAEIKPRVVLSARGLRRDFAGFVAVNNVDLDVHHGQIHALIGPNGAGKTTVALQRPSGLGFQFWRSLAALDQLTPRARELLAVVGLDDVAHRPAGDLSYGRKRVLEIATTLALDPKVLLLDEPMAGMGHEDVGVISGIIRSLATDRAVLMVEHNLTVVADLCDWITVMQRGQVLAAGDYATVSNDERVRVAYMGTEQGDRA